MAAALNARTLDILERQALIDFWGDEDGFFWHHRILLLPGASPGRWIVATPDLEVQFTDISEHRVVPLARAEEFPADYRGYIYSSMPPSSPVVRWRLSVARPAL